MLEVTEAGGLATIQDVGRPGWRRFGVPVSGPMDAFAFQAANLLVGNTLKSAAIEVAGGDLRVHAVTDCVIGVTGDAHELAINSWNYAGWGSYFVRAGWEVRLTAAGGGMWSYVALAGGIAARTVLGSASTYLRGRLGGVDGRLIQAGDVLRPAGAPRNLMEIAGRSLHARARRLYSGAPTVGVILGPQAERFKAESLDHLLSSAYRVSLTSDRMGYRLEGPTLVHDGSADLISEGMTPGAIQVPDDGAPIVMMADCATAGGYPKIACITRADLPLAAQCRPGKDELRFLQTTVQAAQEKYHALMKGLAGGIVEAEAI